MISIISCLMSHVVLDPTGLLKPNEIYFRSSVPIVNPDTQTPFNVLEGDVVVCLRYVWYLHGLISATDWQVIVLHM